MLHACQEVGDVCRVVRDSGRVRQAVQELPLRWSPNERIHDSGLFCEFEFICLTMLLCFRINESNNVLLLVSTTLSNRCGTLDLNEQVDHLRPHCKTYRALPLTLLEHIVQ
jgi:hypothetical protein